MDPLSTTPTRASMDDELETTAQLAQETVLASTPASAAASDAPTHEEQSRKPSLESCISIPTNVAPPKVQTHEEQLRKPSAPSANELLKSTSCDSDPRRKPSAISIDVTDLPSSSLSFDQQILSERTETEGQTDTYHSAVQWDVKKVVDVYVDAYSMREGRNSITALSQHSMITETGTSVATTDAAKKMTSSLIRELGETPCNKNVLTWIDSVDDADTDELQSDSGEITNPADPQCEEMPELDIDKIEEDAETEGKVKELLMSEVPAAISLATEMDETNLPTKKTGMEEEDEYVATMGLEQPDMVEEQPECLVEVHDEPSLSSHDALDLLKINLILNTPHQLARPSLCDLTQSENEPKFQLEQISEHLSCGMDKYKPKYVTKSHSSDQPKVKSKGLPMKSTSLAEEGRRDFEELISVDDMQQQTKEDVGQQMRKQTRPGETQDVLQGMKTASFIDQKQNAATQDVPLEITKTSSLEQTLNAGTQDALQDMMDMSSVEQAKNEATQYVFQQNKKMSSVEQNQNAAAQDGEQHERKTYSAEETQNAAMQAPQTPMTPQMPKAPLTFGSNDNADDELSFKEDCSLNGSVESLDVNPDHQIIFNNLRNDDFISAATKLCSEEHYAADADADAEKRVADMNQKSNGEIGFVADVEADPAAESARDADDEEDVGGNNGSDKENLDGDDDNDEPDIEEKSRQYFFRWGSCARSQSISKR